MIGQIDLDPASRPRCEATPLERANCRLRRRTRRLGAAAAAFSMAVGALSGCGATQVERFTVDVPPGASQLGIDVRNELGGVDIRVDPDAERIRVRAAKQITGAAPRTRRAAALDDIDVYPDVEAPSSGRGVVHLIVGARDADQGHDRSVQLSIITPRCDGVRIHAAGDVLLDGVGGAIEVETRRGAIEMRSSRALVEPIALITGAGNVYLRISPESAAEFDIQAPQGRAWFRSRLAPLVAASYTPHRVLGVLNGGGNPVLVRTGDGDVTVRIADKPESVRR